MNLKCGCDPDAGACCAEGAPLAEAFVEAGKVWRHAKTLQGMAEALPGLFASELEFAQHLVKNGFPAERLSKSVQDALARDAGSTIAAFKNLTPKGDDS